MCCLCHCTRELTAAVACTDRHPLGRFDVPADAGHHGRPERHRQHAVRLLVRRITPAYGQVIHHEGLQAVA